MVTLLGHNQSMKMPDSGIISSMPPGPPQQPPVYSPPAPPPPGPYLHISDQNDENAYLGYNGGEDNNGNYSRPMNNNRTVSFSNSNNNPDDPNNNGNGGDGHMDDMDTNGGDVLMTLSSGNGLQRDLFEEIRNGGGHWSQLLRQVVLTPPANEDFSMSKDEVDEGDGGENSGSSSAKNHVVPLQIVGGSENGQFVYVGITNQDINRWITVGYLQPGDILLEIQGQQVINTSFLKKFSFLFNYQF